jgi:hypothetical protein
MIEPVTNGRGTGTEEQTVGANDSSNMKKAKFAEKLVVSFEKKRGWRAEIAGRKGVNYDVISRGPIGEVRNIEVKYESNLRDIEYYETPQTMSSNYYIYVVNIADGSANATLYVVPPDVIHSCSKSVHKGLLKKKDFEKEPRVVTHQLRLSSYLTS